MSYKLNPIRISLIYLKNSYNIKRDIYGLIKVLHKNNLLLIIMHFIQIYSFIYKDLNFNNKYFINVYMV